MDGPGRWYLHCIAARFWGVGQTSIVELSRHYRSSLTPQFLLINYQLLLTHSIRMALDYYHDSYQYLQQLDYDPEQIMLAGDYASR